MYTCYSLGFSNQGSDIKGRGFRPSLINIYIEFVNQKIEHICYESYRLHLKIVRRLAHWAYTQTPLKLAKACRQLREWIILIGGLPRLLARWLG